MNGMPRPNALHAALPANSRIHPASPPAGRTRLPTTTTPNQRPLHTLSLLFLLASLMSCASPTTSRPSTPAPITPITSTTYAIRGGPLVIPVEVARGARTDRALDCRLDDGRAQPCTLDWIGVAPSEDTTGYRWLPDPFRWTVTPAGRRRPATPAGFWAVSIDLSRDAVGQGFWIAGSRLDLTWLPDPALATLDAEPMPWPAAAPPEAFDSAYFGRLVDPVRHNPLTRWRYKLLVDGLRPALPNADHADPTGFDDPVLEALARRTEDLWRAAIARVRQDDRDLARRFVRHLVDAVDFGDGAVAPAWPTQQLVLDTVQDAILRPRSTRASRIQAVTQWLEEQPRAVAWVIDEGGQTDGLSGDPLASIGVANLGRASVLASATDPDRPNRRDFVTVRAGAASTVVAPVPDTDRDGATIEINVGAWRETRVIRPGPRPATPPGLAISPLLGDWTMGAWLGGEPTPNIRADARLGAAMRLYKDTGAEGAPWLLYAELPAELDDRYATPLAGTDWFRLWIGPFEAPHAIIKVWRDGRVVDELADQPRPALDAARVIDEGTRWTALVPIDPDLIDEDRTIRLGIERLDARARRWAWPLPMLPWQIEPARAWIDLDAWN